MALTDTACRNAKPQEKAYKRFDSGGLFLLIKPNGAKLWRLKYRFVGKEKLLALGTYPLTSLAQAREGRDKAKKLLAGDPPIDPMAHREERRHLALRNAENTFEVVAREWHEVHKGGWSRGYPGKVMRGLEKNIFPHLGRRPVAVITPPELLECLRKIESRGALEIAARTKQVCGQIFRYGIQTGRCERDAAADLKGALKSRQTDHYASIEVKDLPKFIETLERNDARLYSRTQRAIWLSLLTFCRPGEIRQAQWSEVDFDARQWSIPASKMKKRRDHIVPLSDQAVSILKGQKEETGYLNTDWVFPSQIRPKKPMSDGTVNKAIKRLGFGEDMVAHGMRALARTAIRENLGFDSEVIEKQLAHKTKNPLGEAYDRTQFLPMRKKMMQAWADYLDAIAGQENVIVHEFKKSA